jgi:hypothetical protein
MSKFTHVAVHAIQHIVDGKVSEIRPGTEFTPADADRARLEKIGAAKPVKRAAVAPAPVEPEKKLDGGKK